MAAMVPRCGKVGFDDEGSEVVGQGASVQELANIRGRGVGCGPWKGQLPPYFAYTRGIFLAGLLISEKWAVRITTRSRHQL